MEAPVSPALDPTVFRRKLMAWYRVHARRLPWRGSVDPYAIWVSEVMLQQTRVAAVIEHYHRFLSRFPTVRALAAASESEVLAVWSGLGYYRRARMMHQAAQAIVERCGGVFPATSAALRLLPGIGEYTSAAIASIAFGQSVAVIDGNVERVLLRLTGRAEDTTSAGKVFLREVAARLVPAANRNKGNPPGDHNQAVMELGATICLPRGPLCLQCPVHALCHTRGEHLTAPRGQTRVQTGAYLLALRCDGHELLLQLRPANTRLMAGMYELPGLSLDAVTGREPLLRLRHSITNIVYAVEVHTFGSDEPLSRLTNSDTNTLHWQRLDLLGEIPLTGLTRKALRKLQLIL